MASQCALLTWEAGALRRRSRCVVCCASGLLCPPPVDNYSVSPKGCSRPNSAAQREPGQGLLPAQSRSVTQVAGELLHRDGGIAHGDVAELIHPKLTFDRHVRHWAG